MSIDPSKYPIITPTWPVPVDTPEALQLAYDAEKLAKLGHPLVVGGLSPHDRSRSYMAARALHLHPHAFGYVWIDDDSRPEISQVQQLCETFELERVKLERLRLEANAPRGDASFKLATLTGVYICRHHAARGRLAVNFSPHFSDPSLPEMQIDFREHGGIHRVVSHGMGFAVVAPYVFDALEMPEAIYDDLEGGSYEGKAWFLPDVIDKHHAGEDRSFTFRIYKRHLGLSLVDTRNVIVHGGYTLGPPVLESRGQPTIIQLSE